MLVFALVMITTAGVAAKNILLVDDDRHVREATRLLLSIDQHTVTEAANGQEALELFMGASYDLVITDYLMPQMLGDELAQRIRTRAPDQPILMITAYLEQLANTEHPVDAVLGKPVSLDGLRRAMAGSVQDYVRTEMVRTAAPAELSPAGLTHRAATTTSVLEEILQRKGPVRLLPHWAGHRQPQSGRT